MNLANSHTADRGLVDAYLSLPFEALPMGTWNWDLRTNEVVWAPAFERIHGLDAEKGGSGGWVEAFQRTVHPADRARILDAVGRLISEGRDVRIEYRIVYPDRAVRWFEARGRLLRNREGNPERTIGLCSDITERRASTFRAGLSDAFHSATLMSITDAVVTTDAESRVISMNGAAESLTGWQLDEAKTRPLDEVVPTVPDPVPLPDRLSPHRGDSATPAGEDEPSAASTSANTASLRNAKLLVRRDGSTVAIDHRVTPVCDEHGDIAGSVVVLRDVTEERQEASRAWFIAEASTLLTSILDFRKTLTAIAQFAVRRVSDWCAVYAVAEDGSLERLFIAHRDESQADLASRLEKYQPSVAYPNEVIRTGKSVLISALSEAHLRAGAASEAHFEILRRMDLASYLVAPLRARDRILGAITFMTTGGIHLNERDLHMAEELGRRAGTAMENARLYEEAQRARLAAEASAARVALIQEMTAALSQAPTLSLVAEVVTSLGAKATGATAATLFQLTSSGEEVELVRAFGLPGALLSPYGRISMDSNLPVVECTKTGRLLFYRSREELARDYPEMGRLATLASWACVPLEVEGRRLGALGMSFAMAHEFNEVEVDFILTMSRLCAEALARANLYELAQHARAEAESARRTRENLMAIVSHDLRNPLGAIATSATVITKADPAREPPGRIARAGANILRAAQRMDRLIVDLLDLAKIESGRLVIECQAQDATSLIKDSVAILTPVALGKGVTLVADLPAAYVCIFCDRERIMQVLSNLIGNALKFTAEGGTVTVSVREMQGKARFAVSDTGSGIAADQLPHIFDRYWQAKSGREGVGLGLSIAKGVVEAHGGRIWVETQIGQGTTFFFMLPNERDIGAGPSETGAVEI